MKKLFSVILIIALVFSFSACRKNPSINSSGKPSPSDNKELVENKESGTTQSDSEDIPVVEEPEAPQHEPQPQPEVKPKPEVKPEHPSVEETPASTPTKQEPNFGPPVRDLKGKNLNHMLSSVPYYEIDLPGTIVDYLTIGDEIHILLTEENLYNVYDSNTGKIVFSLALDGDPGAIRLINGQVWISVYSVGIMKFDKTTHQLSDTIQKRHVGSFDVYKNILYYASFGEDGYVSEYDMDTQKEINLNFTIPELETMTGMLYLPSVCVDSDSEILYVATGRTSDSKIFGFDINTYECKGIHDKNSENNTGFFSTKRRIILFDGEVYWCNVKINPSAFWRSITSYGSSTAAMLYVDKDYVITTSGIYENNTGKVIVNIGENYIIYDAKNRASATITESKNIMIANHKKMYIFYG